MMIPNSGRQMFHLSTAFFIVANALLFGTSAAIFWIIIGIIFGLYAKFIGKPNRVISTLAAMYDREGRRYAPFLYLIGILFAFLLFDLKIAILATVALGVGDSVSALLGRGHRIPYSRKTFMGSMAGFLVTFVVLLSLTDYLTAMSTAFVAMFIESFDWPDDNIPIVLGTSVFLSLFI